MNRPKYYRYVTNLWVWHLFTLFHFPSGWWCICAYCNYKISKKITLVIPQPTTKTRLPFRCIILFEGTLKIGIDICWNGNLDFVISDKTWFLNIPAKNTVKIYVLQSLYFLTLDGTTSNGLKRQQRRRRQTRNSSARNSGTILMLKYLVNNQ